MPALSRTGEAWTQHNWRSRERGSVATTEDGGCSWALSLAVCIQQLQNNPNSFAESKNLEPPQHNLTVHGCAIRTFLQEDTKDQIYGAAYSLDSGCSAHGLRVSKCSSNTTRNQPVLCWLKKPVQDKIFARTQKKSQLLPFPVLANSALTERDKGKV